MINNKIESSLIQIIPERINLKKYNPQKTNEQTITICNNCNIPLILYLYSSDSNILILKETSIKIGIKQKKTLSFIISDKNYYKNKKNLSKPKKLFIFIKNDLIEEKFEVILSYTNIDNSSYSENKNNKMKSYITLNNQNKNRDKLFSYENKNKIIPNNIKKTNLRKILKNHFNIQSDSNRLKTINQRNNEMYENNNNTKEYLNNSISDLRKQISYLKEILENSKLKINQLDFRNSNYYKKLEKENCISFFIIGNNKRDTFLKKFEINYDNERTKRELYEYQNQILKDENDKLKNLVSFLENRLLPYEQHSFQNQNNNYNRNKNYIINNYNFK